MFITTHQLNGFKAQAPRNFARRLVDHADVECAGRRACSGEVIPRGDELEARVHELIGIAQSFGIATEMGVAQFVVLGLGYAREFHRTPRVMEMLAATDRSPDQSIQHVLNAVIVAEARVA